MGEPLTSGACAWRISAGNAPDPVRPVQLTLDRPRILAILNCTPDSFSDGGLLPTIEDAVARARCALDEGADGLDIGGESTRPGAGPVAPGEQVRRIVGVIGAIREQLGWAFPISVDTTRAEVARAALDAGADAINDVSAGLDDPAMLGLAAERGCGIILMHRLVRPDRDVYSDRYVREQIPGSVSRATQDPPTERRGTQESRASPRPADGAAGHPESRATQDPPAPRYAGGVIACVRDFLRERAGAAIGAGVDRGAIVLDPGLGFGKTVEQNLQLIAQTAELVSLGFPIMSGLSRKSFVGRASGLPADSRPADRIAGSIALSVMHYLAGASIFRVHDVRPHVQALCAAAAIRETPPGFT